MEKEVIELIAGILEIPVEKFDIDAEMEEIENWDSLRNVMIIASLEDEYDISIPQDDMFDLVSARALVEEVKKLTKE